MAAAEWLIIGFIILVVFLVVKVASKKQEAAVKLTLVLFLFFMITAGYVYVTNDVDVTSVDGMMFAAKIYWAWLTTIAGNVVDISSYVIHQDWGLNASAASTNATR